MKEGNTMMKHVKPYCIVYRRTGHPEVEEYFDREIDMENHVIIWLDGDVDYVNYFYFDVEYTPSWAK
jgi:hypothetical protein